MKKKFFILLFFVIFLNCCATVYNPTIIKQHNYGEFDISFVWKFKDNTLHLTGINNFWTELFNITLNVTPVDKNMKPIGNTKKRFIGSLEMDKKFQYIYKFNAKNIRYIRIDYFYNYSGYNSSGSILNFYTVYIDISS